MWKYFFLKENIKIRVLFSIALSFYIFLFIYLLEPLKSETIHYNYPFYFNILGLLSCFISIFLFSVVLPLLFPLFFEPKNWSFSRFVLWFIGICLSTAVAAYFFDVWAYQLPFSVTALMEYLFSYQIFIDFFIATSIFLFFLYQYPQSIKEQSLENISSVESKEGKLINKQIGQSAPIEKETLHLNSENERNSLNIDLEDLYFITSANNYVEIFYKKGHDESLNRLLMRSSLKKIEEQNQNLIALFRCHKAYIVNSQKIKNVKGNSKGYFLILENVKESIPVSRQKNEELEKRFPHFL